MLNFLGYACSYLSGLFFGVMVLTIIENASKGFRQFVRKVCNKIITIADESRTAWNCLRERKDKKIWIM